MTGSTLDERDDDTTVIRTTAIEPENNEEEDKYLTEAMPSLESCRKASQTVTASFDSNLDIGLYASKVHVLSNEQRYKLITTPWKPPDAFILPCAVQKSQRRFFNAVWLDRYSWMSYSKALCRKKVAKVALYVGYVFCLLLKFQVKVDITGLNILLLSLVLIIRIFMSFVLLI